VDTEEIRFRAKAGGQVWVHPLVIHMVMDAAPATAWQVIQALGRLRVLAAGARPPLDPGNRRDPLRARSASSHALRHHSGACRAGAAAAINVAKARARLGHWGQKSPRKRAHGPVPERLQARAWK